MILAISFLGIVASLPWLALALMAFWIWSASKAKASLFTLIGGAIIGVVGLLSSFGVNLDATWLVIGGSVLLALGYYYTVKPIVDKHIQDLKEKAKAKTSSGGSSTPPPTA